MLRTYLNYPDANVSVHWDVSCGQIQKHRKAKQRTCRVDCKTFSEEIQKFAAGDYTFRSTPVCSDMWLDVDFGDPEFELAVVCHIHGLLGKRFCRFRTAKLKRHSCQGESS